jgi:hypothetical protein
MFVGLSRLGNYIFDREKRPYLIDRQAIVAAPSGCRIDHRNGIASHAVRCDISHAREVVAHAYDR